MDETDGTCSVAKLGELLDLSPPRIQQLAKEGIIPRDVGGRYDLAGAIRGYNQHLQEQANDDPTLIQAKTANEILKVRERRLRIDQMKAQLIDRAQATSLVFRLAREERQAWQIWPSCVAALMAADLGADAAAMQFVLEEHVRKHLGELAEIKPKFG